MIAIKSFVLHHAGFWVFMYFIDRNSKNRKCIAPVMPRLIFYLVCKFLWKI